jgi:hypothetical protein
MRRCVEEATEPTGITRTVLHATADGYPLYVRVGYRPVDEFSIYVPVRPCPMSPGQDGSVLN